MWIVRRIDNPRRILYSGYPDGPGKLGSFDPAVYEEVEGLLPEDFELETPSAPLADQLDAVFSQQSIDLQAQFSPLRAAIKLELDQGRFAIAKRVIELAEIPPELEAQRQALLALFPEA